VCRMAEPDQPALHPALDIAVARREAKAGLVERGEGDLVGAVGVGGVRRREDVGGVGDAIVGFLEGLQADVVAGGRGELLVGRVCSETARSATATLSK
jgi:hypothetical protein